MNWDGKQLNEFFVNISCLWWGGFSSLVNALYHHITENLLFNRFIYTVEQRTFFYRCIYTAEKWTFSTPAD